VVAGALSILALGIVGAAASSSAENSSAKSASATASSDPATQILNAIDSPRVVSLKTQDGTAEAIGQATSSQGDAARSMWYTTVAGSAFAEQVGVRQMSFTVVDSSSGTTLENDRDFVSLNQVDPFEKITLSASDVDNLVNQQAQSLGVKVISIHYVGLYGGGAEIVVQPDDPGVVPGSFINALLGPLAAQNRPNLVTVVDANGAPQLVIGWAPGVGGWDSQGMEWVAPGVQTDTVSAWLPAPSGS
jgi:hypothetical protein